MCMRVCTECMREAGDCESSNFGHKVFLSLILDKQPDFVEGLKGGKMSSA